MNETIETDNNLMRAIASRTKAFLTAKKRTAPQEETQINPKEAPVIIVGAGIVGLVLALALQKHVGIKAELYEKAKAFHDDVGAGMGMYPNGLRVIRDIDPELLARIQSAGYPYLMRRLERHDGTEVAVADESVLSEEEDLQSIGIRRWRLQKILFEAVQAAGIKIHFNKRLEGIKQVDDDMHLRFTGGYTRVAKLLLAADGARSQVRKLVSGGKCKLHYSGVTCLMGTATIAREARGICLPSSATTKCHGAFYPTGPTEQCFQFHFPVPAESATKGSSGSWGNLTEQVGQEECGHLAERLKKDGWDEKYLTPLHHVDKALMIGFSNLDPPLESFTHGRVVLLGDAAHPPVPYLGQGAQQGLEDAGTLALLLQRLCCVVEGGCDGEKANKCFSLGHVDAAIKLYDQMRVPRTAAVLEKGKNWGNMQQKKSECKKYNEVKEEMMQRDVFFHETFPVLFLGAKHDYKEEVMRTLEEVRLLPVPEEESF